MKRFAALVCLALAFALPPAHAQQTPDDQYIVIYNLIQQADAYQAAGQSRQALADYTQALAELQKFQKIFPNWESNIIGFRLNYLRGKINDLAAQLPPPAPTNAPPNGSNPPPVAANPPLITPKSPGNAETEYFVVEGDVLGKIAIAHGITLKALEAANPDVEPTKLQVGQKLIIPAGGATAPAEASATSPGATSVGDKQIYVVQSGDTLSKIAKTFGTTVQAIQTENNLTTTLIKVDQKLRIPAQAETVAQAPVAAPAPVTPTVAPGTTPAPTTLPPTISTLTTPAPSTPAPATPAPTNTVSSETPPRTNAVFTAPAPDLDVQLVTLRAQVQGLQSQNETLQAKLREALSAQPATVDTQELARAQTQVLSLMKENDLLRASMKSIPTNGAPEELLKAQQALADANQKLAAQTSRAEKLALENQALQARLQPLLAESDTMQTLRAENAALKKRVAELEISATNATAGAGADLARARAQIAALQSDASIARLEKTTLEDRLRRLQSAPAAASSDVSEEVKTLRARIAVDEASAVPYSPEELALLRSSAPAVNAGGQKKSINELPSGSALLVAEAQSFFSAGQYDKAEADYRQILESSHNNPLALANLAAIELQENKLTDAETHITAALAQSPNDAYSLSTLGYLKFRQQKYDAAFDALSRAAKLDPENPQIQNYLGVTLSHKGLRAQAQNALRKAIELDPNYGAAHNNLAAAYLADKPPMTGLARWHYQKALDNGQPHNPELEKMLADMGAPVSE